MHEAQFAGCHSLNVIALMIWFDPTDQRYDKYKVVAIFREEWVSGIFLTATRLGPPVLSGHVMTPEGNIHTLWTDKMWKKVDFPPTVNNY